jgi:PTS system cellobiose-specific IIB component
LKKFLVLCKETTGQSVAFKRVILEHTEKNNVPVQWFFADDKAYISLIESNQIDLVLISPEVILIEKQIKAELDKRNIEYFSMKPIDFGLRRMEKLMPALEPYINKN